MRKRKRIELSARESAKKKGATLGATNFIALNISIKINRIYNEHNPPQQGVSE
jgi:hypothetical protein